VKFRKSRGFGQDQVVIVTVFSRSGQLALKRRSVRRFLGRKADMRKSILDGGKEFGRIWLRFHMQKTTRKKSGNQAVVDRRGPCSDAYLSYF